MQANTKKVIIVASVAGALAIVGIALLMRSKRKKLEKMINSGSQDVIIPASESVSSVVYPLRKGAGVTEAERNAVRVVQRYLNAKIMHFYISIPPLAEDGIFGPKTEDALSKISGIKEVSYSYYKSMLQYLYKAPELLDPNTGSYRAPGTTDPNVLKSNLVNIPSMTLFG